MNHRKSIYHATPTKNVKGILSKGFSTKRVFFATSLDTVVDYIEQERAHGSLDHRKSDKDWTILEIKQPIGDLFPFEFRKDPYWDTPGEYYTEGPISSKLISIYSRLKFTD